MIQGLKTQAYSGSIAMSEDLSEMDYMSLKTTWIDICHDVKNLQARSDKYPEDTELKTRLEKRESLKRDYEMELDKRRC